MSVDLFLKVFALVMFLLAAFNAPCHPKFNYGWAGVAAAYFAVVF